MNGAWIRQRRKGLRLTQTELGRRLGVSQEQISCWETNKSAPAEHHAVTLRHILDISDGGTPSQASADTTRHVGDARGSQHLTETSHVALSHAPASVTESARRAAPQIGEFGRFVAEDGSITIGKVRALDGEKATLEVFRSPVAPEFETLTLAFAELEVFDVPRQTLVYQRRRPYWVMGRTISREVRGHFALKLPNESEPVAVPRDEVFLRSPGLSDDPTALLAAQATSSPHFTEARHRFIEFVNSQRARYRGLTALASARIEFHPHQIAAVRRVLSDPIHRYLLADEVGLGKTIEAGLLISQHLIDEGKSASVLVLVPDSLQDQWTEELAKSFGLRDDPRVRILPFAALERTDSAPLSSPAPTLTVVDEAHRSAAWAFPRDRGLDAAHAAGHDTRYQALDGLAQCPKLLLLSGTPVLNHEDGFLAMLHLLEPDAYDLADRNGFRKRVAARKVVANALAELTPDFQPGFLSEALTRLTREVEGDGELDERVRAVVSALASAPSAAGTAVEDLRSYLLERYRLHRRILRTHREAKSVACLLPRRCGMSVFSTAEDPGRIRAFEAIDEWRRRALDANLGNLATAAFVFGKLLTCAFSHPRQLGRIFERRASTVRHDDTLACFPDEESWLQNVASELTQTSEFARTSALVEQLAGPLARRRSVVFVDAPDEAAAVVEQLQQSAELRQRVLRFVPGAAGALTLYEQISNAILVCDRSAEEGLNLQRKPATIIFFDLPFDIGRIEQRIGRFDRLEGMKELRFLTATPVGPYEIAWARLLIEHIKIFDRSIARLQYVLAEAMETLLMELLEAGPDEAFEAITARFADPETGLEPLLKQLRRQETLDATEWRDGELQDFQASISEARDISIDDAQDAMQGWLTELKFEIKEVPERGIWYTHVRRDRGNSTILAISSLDEAVERWLDQEASRWGLDATHRAYGPFIFDPDNESETASLLSVGHPFFDAVFACMKIDDRSRSWGIWRYDPVVLTPQVYVCFDFSIEASLATLSPLVRRWRTLASLRRRADAILPVEHRRVWLDAAGVPVADPVLTSRLERPYAKETRGVATDQNLNRERWALANQHLPIADWTARITTIRAEFEGGVRAEAEIQRRCKAAEGKVHLWEQQTIRILRSRATHVCAREKQAVEAAIRLEQELGAALRKGVLAPDLCVDNAGVIILAPEPLG